MMLRILTCIISLLGYFSLLAAQNYDSTSRHLRIGVDVLPAIQGFLNGKSMGVEFSVDRGFGKYYYAVLESGWQTASYGGTNFDYNSSGFVFRTGIDDNVFRVKKTPSNDVIVVGLRYAYSRMTYNADNIVLASGYWNGQENRRIAPYTFGNHWIELKGGIKVEALHNIFIGWSLAVKILLSSGHDPSMKAYLIPGYGKGANNTALGFNYYLSYRIP